ncbi:MAG: hypothetical protein HeimC3_47670 [Candidatus Heimdallarchaeota archaeon LC_3]|nr:MAG: hypothetical protein HeimC3_47670 [Candidatus Heimdallarchaeota archaeon LC_3]
MPKSLHYSIRKSEKSFFRECSTYNELMLIFKALDESNNDIVLSTHTNADPDGIGAIFGLFNLFSYFYPEKKIFFGINSLSRFSSQILSSLELEEHLTKNSIESNNFKLNLDRNKYYDLIICDTHNYSNIQLLETDLLLKVQNVFIIDHHLETEHSTQDISKYSFSSNTAEHKYVCNNYKASSEIVLQLMYMLDHDLRSDYLKVLIIGILTDSRRLMLADAPLFKLLAFWLEKQDDFSISSLFEELDNDYSKSEKIARLKGAQRVIIRQIQDYIICFTNISSYEASTAKALILIGADITCAIAETKKETRISLRGKMNALNVLSLHLGELAGKIASKFADATGSGHKGAAGINIPGIHRWQDIRKELEIIILEEINEKLSKIQGKKTRNE